MVITSRQAGKFEARIAISVRIDQLVAGPRDFSGMTPTYKSLNASRLRDEARLSGVSCAVHWHAGWDAASCGA
jgi:hypothetical protein